MAANQQSPDDSAFAQNPVTQVPSDRREGLLGLVGGHGKSSVIDDMVTQHHAARLSNAQMYSNAAKDATAAIVHINQGIDPETGQRFDDPSYKGQGADALRSKYQANYDESWGNYKKIAGVNPETKGALAKAEAILQHIMGQGAVQGVGPAPSGGGQRGMTPPPTPPGGGGAPQATVMEGGVTLTPPPTPPGQSATTPAPSPSGGPDFAAQAPFVRAGMEEQHQFGQWKRMQDVLRDNKIAENEALTRARMSNQKAPRPAGSMSTSVLDAQKMMAGGKIFKGYDGSPIDVDSLDPTMGLKGMLVWNQDTNDFEPRYEPFSPNQSVVTVGNESFAVSPMDKSKLASGGAGQALGPKAVPSTTRTTDPATGQTTVSTRTPQTTGIAGRGMSAPPTPPGTTPSSTQAPTPKRAAAPVGTSPAAHAVLPTNPPALDENNHIPSGTSTPQVVEGANQLLDGKDVKDIPAKTKELSAALARKYGWEQGKFTPLEKTQIALATRYINEAIASPALKTLDAGFFSQLPMLGASGDPSKEGNIGKAMTKLSSMAQTPEQAEFMRLYRQLAGTISGLGKLSRGGRITEATVNRLLSELPNPANTVNSKDATARLLRLRDEVDAAMSKGSFESVAQGRGMPAPPPAPGSRPPLSSFEH